MSRADEAGDGGEGGGQRERTSHRRPRLIGVHATGTLSARGTKNMLQQWVSVPGAGLVQLARFWLCQCSVPATSGPPRCPSGIKYLPLPLYRYMSSTRLSDTVTGTPQAPHAQHLLETSRASEIKSLTQSQTAHQPRAVWRLHDVEHVSQDREAQRI